MANMNAWNISIKRIIIITKTTNQHWIALKEILSKHSYNAQMAIQM
jgi:hypothetical protein